MAGGCGRRDASAEAGVASGMSGGGAARDAGPADAGGRAAAQVKTSVRCRECHGKMASEWKGSADLGKKFPQIRKEAIGSRKAASS